MVVKPLHATCKAACGIAVGGCVLPEACSAVAPCTVHPHRKAHAQSLLAVVFGLLLDRSVALSNISVSAYLLVRSLRELLRFESFGNNEHSDIHALIPDRVGGCAAAPLLRPKIVAQARQRSSRRVQPGSSVVICLSSRNPESTSAACSSSFSHQLRNAVH